MDAKITYEIKPADEFLQCILTDKELIAKSRELAKANEDLADVEARKKDAVAEFAAKQKKHEANIAELSRVVSTGKEYRIVSCEWQYHYDTGIKNLVRLDTLETIITDNITQKERQMAVTVVDDANAEKKEEVSPCSPA
jgi:hypothetical protein